MPISPGKDVELRFTQVLTDRAGTFQPVMSGSAASNTMVRFIRYSVTIPDAEDLKPYVCIKPYKWIRVEGRMRWDLNQPETIIPIQPDNDGHFEFATRDIRPDHQYELHWSR